MTPKERLDYILSQRRNPLLVENKVKRITPKSDLLKELERLSSLVQPSKDNVIAIKQREMLLNSGINSSNGNNYRGQANFNPEWHHMIEIYTGRIIK